ncbi:MAG: metallophosphoesterase family protein [Firmicutes bacterium]|nr:metallophosphoesterase family protein [Bacillota bacterium]
MRKLFAFLLSVSLLLGCFAMVPRAAAGDEPFRVVTTFYGPGAQGFHWYTKADGAGEVAVNGKAYAGTSEKVQGYYAHSAVADGLAPGTAYTYKIGDTTGAFKTNPGRGAAVNFIVNGDVQASSVENYAVGAATIDAAWGLYGDSAFCVSLGDFTNNCDNEEWDMYFDAFKGNNAKAALVPIAGNHDGNLKWDWFRSMFTLKEPGNFPSNMTGVYYSFDYGDAHFAVLNSNDMYPMSVAQQNWLVNDMSTTDATWKIVFLHRAPYSAGNDALLPDNLLMRRTLIPLFDKLGVDLVMYGHDHHYYRSVPMKADKPDPAGTVYVLPGPAGTKRYDIHENMLPVVKTAAAKIEQTGKPMFSHIEINGGTLDFKAYTYDPEAKKAEQYDAFTLTKSGAAVPDPNYKPLPTDIYTTLPAQIWNLLKGLFYVIFVDYIGILLPQLITGR